MWIRDGVGRSEEQITWSMRIYGGDQEGGRSSLGHTEVRSARWISNWWERWPRREWRVGPSFSSKTSGDGWTFGRVRWAWLCCHHPSQQGIIKGTSNSPRPCVYLLIFVELLSSRKLLWSLRHYYFYLHLVGRGALSDIRRCLAAFLFFFFFSWRWRVLGNIGDRCLSQASNSYLITNIFKHAHNPLYTSTIYKATHNPHIQTPVTCTIRILS